MTKSNEISVLNQIFAVERLQISDLRAYIYLCTLINRLYLNLGHRW